MGPADDEASGLDFIMRTIGRRYSKNARREADDTAAGNEEDETAEAGDEIDEKSDEDEESDCQDKDDCKVLMADRLASKAADAGFLAMVDP